MIVLDTKRFLLATLTSLAWLPFAYSYCNGIGNNPNWIGAPKVEQVTPTSVNVSWNGLLQRDECADSVLVKYYKSNENTNSKLSVGLIVSTIGYLVQDLQPQQSYTYQVIAREEKGIMGVDYNRSPKTVFTTNNAKNDVQEKVFKTPHPQEEVSNVEVYTTNEPVMAKKVEYKGMLLASKVEKGNIISKMVSSAKVLFRAEKSGHSKQGVDIREELLLKLKEKALEVEANAIVGLRMETNSLAGDLVDLVVYGTAVYFER